MALKTVVGKDAFAELSEELQGFYKEDGESYILDVDGVDDHPTVKGLKSKVDELMGETKAEREKRKAIEKAQEEAERKAAEEKGEFKSLWEKTQAELEKERENARNYQQRIQQRELESEAAKLAGTLTRDTKRAELLKKEVMQFARYTDEGVKFEAGGVEIAPEQLLGRLKEDFPFLVDGSGATGGGANGGGSGGAVKGNMGGDKAARLAAIKAKHPELS